jgi:hypothetical protein
MAKTPYTKEAMRKRLAEVSEQAAAIKAKAAPMREARDKVVQAARKEELKLNAEIKKVEEGLFDLEMERATLARGVGTIEAGAGQAETAQQE